MRFGLILFLLVLLPSVLAVEQTFTNVIKIKTNFTNETNSSGIAFVTITTEQDNHTYNCMQNSTNTFNFDLKRNLSDALEVSSSLNNLTSNVNNVLVTCDKIAQAYGDTNRYFQLYSTCNTDFELCKKSRDEHIAKATELSAFQSDYQSCSVNLGNAQSEQNRLVREIIPTLQTNVSSCQANLGKANNSKFLWAIIGALVIGVFWTLEQKKINPATRKSKIVGLGPRQN